MRSGTGPTLNGGRHDLRGSARVREAADMSKDDVPTRWTASTVFTDMWVDPDNDPRDTGVQLIDERSTLLEYLRAYRLTFEMKCAGLTPEQLAQQSVPPSTLSLLGLL